MIRLAHFSDPHLLSLKGSRVRDFLNKRWIGGLNLLSSRAYCHQTALFESLIEDLKTQQLDHIICTGDLTNVALPSEFEFAQSLFKQMPLKSSEITVIPGNHDAYVDIGKEHFHQWFGDYCTSDDGFKHETLWPFVRVRGNVAIIGLSTSHETPWFTAWGEVGKAQRDRLSEILASPELNTKFRIIAIHHPPSGNYAHHRRHGLHDWDAFAEILKHQGAELVLHGHRHHDIQTSLPGSDGAIVVQGVSSVTYTKKQGTPLGAGYRIYTIDSSNTRTDTPTMVNSERRIWNGSMFVSIEQYNQTCIA